MMRKKQTLLHLIAKNIRQARHERSFSQEELAERAEVHRTYIGMLERAERNLTVASLEKISRALDKPIAYFFEDNSKENKK